VSEVSARSGTTDGAWLVVAIPAALMAGLIGLLLSFAIIAGGTASCGGGETVGALSQEVPKRLVPIYQEAAAEYHLGQRGPSILASINWHETSFGENQGESSAGAEGWMQFPPSSWEAFGVDGDKDGDRDPSDPWDAIFAAANLLHHEGAPGDWWGAIWHYNHADWYVEEVLSDAKKFATAGNSAVSAGDDCEAAALAPNEAVAKMIAEADRLSAIRPRTRYVYGGSHGESPTPADGPFDCSSAVSHLLQVAGFDNPTMDTIALLGWAEPGPGKWVSIYDKPYGADAHTFIKFMPGITPASKRFWGTSGFVAPGHGPGWIPESTFSASYLSGFQVLHPAGL
jgi:hypothetical protein